LPRRRHDRRRTRTITGRQRPRPHGEPAETGRHLTHVASAGAALYGENVSGLLDSSTYGRSDAKQKRICAYCHEDPKGRTSRGPALQQRQQRQGYIHRCGRSIPPTSPQPTTTRPTTEPPTPAPTSTATTTSFTTDGTYGWYDADAPIACAMCHANVTAGGTPPGPPSAHTERPGCVRRAIACRGLPQRPRRGEPGTYPLQGNQRRVRGVRSVTFSYAVRLPEHQGQLRHQRLLHNNGPQRPPGV